MALPTSGTLSFSQIQTELGGSNPISMDEYRANSSIPNSGAISVSDFYGASAGANLSQTYPTFLKDSTSNTSGTAVARLRFDANGTVTGLGNDTIFPTTDWIIPSSDSGGTTLANTFQVFATRSNSLIGGTYNQWVDLRTSPQFTQVQSGRGTKTTDVTLKLRDSLNPGFETPLRTITIVAQVGTSFEI